MSIPGDAGLSGSTIENDVFAGLGGLSSSRSLQPGAGLSLSDTAPALGEEEEEVRGLCVLTDTGSTQYFPLSVAWAEDDIGTAMGIPASGCAEFGLSCDTYSG